MSEFINEFGKENFIILIAIIGAIVLALIIIIVIEKLQAKAKLRKQIKKEINNIEYNAFNETKNDTFVEDKYVNESVEVLEAKNDVLNDEVYYVENIDTETEAKEKLEEVTKRLIDEQDDGLIDHTHFEVEQEEKSIISYDELVKVSHDIDEKNDKLLADEDEAAITLEELYKKHSDEQNIIEEVSEPKVEIKVNNPIFEDDEPKKFKNSEVISPVFGFYSGEVKQESKVPAREIFNEMDKETSMSDLESEIQKTEDFLSELKRLKNKLD